MKITTSIEHYPVGMTFTRERWAAQCYTTTYYRTAGYCVARRKKDGKKFAQLVWGGGRGHGGPYDASADGLITSCWVQVRWENGVRVGRLVGCKTSPSHSAPAGCSWKVDDDGVGMIIRDSDGMDYHPTADDMQHRKFKSRVLEGIISNRRHRLEVQRSLRESQRIARIRSREIGSCRVTLRDSRLAGNCVEGSLRYCETRLGIPREQVISGDYLFSVPAHRLLKTNGHPGVQRAVQAAWLRETTVSI